MVMFIFVSSFDFHLRFLCFSCDLLQLHAFVPVRMLHFLRVFILVFLLRLFVLRVALPTTYDSF